ncbi:uncharacterized protein LOC131897100 [Peromyscus eremicus]|uniref:uncharacterized protein LOC131897100 n=1 Tax=Peromyscus eremicus TaxID=42410 RepID=UPI0027DE62AA|nr:uncharacterized protein LOC131897100 [Peromyscus eremicus]
MDGIILCTYEGSLKDKEASCSSAPPTVPSSQLGVSILAPQKQSQSPTTLRAAASLRVGSPAHSSGLPGRGGATSCESREAEPGRPLYLGLFLRPELHKDLAVLRLPIAFPRPTWLRRPPSTSPPLLVSSSFDRVWFELSNPPIIALGSLLVGASRQSPSLARFLRTTSRTKHGECDGGAATGSSEGTAGAVGCPGWGVPVPATAPDGRPRLDRLLVASVGKPSPPGRLVPGTSLLVVLGEHAVWAARRPWRPGAFTSTVRDWRN